jgi:hypothetical protein
MPFYLRVLFLVYTRLAPAEVINVCLRNFDKYVQNCCTGCRSNFLSQVHTLSLPDIATPLHDASPTNNEWHISLVPTNLSAGNCHGSPLFQFIPRKHNRPDVVADRTVQHNSHRSRSTFPARRLSPFLQSQRLGSVL